MVVLGVESEEGKGSRFWFRLPRVFPLLFLLAFNLFAQALPQHCYELFDSTYNANLQGRYADAWLYAENAINIVEEPIDTSLLVSLYNEQAIAAQALGDWEAYRQSNAECVRLHRLFSTDCSLASDCQQLEKMNADSRVLYVLIVLLLIASLTLFYMVVLRHRLRHRASMDDLYQRLSSLLQTFPQNAETYDAELQVVAQNIEQPGLKKAVQEMRQKFTPGLARLQKMGDSIEDFEEKTHKQRFEHDRLYVMNQILDNSLSTIKHETMYFPSRIKQMADDMQQNGIDVETNHNLLDLVTYYRHIYMLLYEQAQRQTDQSLLRMQSVSVADLFTFISKTHEIDCQETNLQVLGDEMLLRLLLGQMLAVVSANATLCVEEHDSMTYIICNVKGQKFTPEQLSDLFSPQTERLEYLVMRQILRECDAACGHPGLRLEAENTEQGYNRRGRQAGTQRHPANPAIRSAGSRNHRNCAR